MVCQCPLAISASVMTPMVFWASLVPCDNEISDAPPTCPQRKPASTYRWATPLVMRSTTEVPKVATKIAMTGEIRLGTTTLPTTPSSFVPSPTQLTPAMPMPAIVAPTRPPNRAWDELEGSPFIQVKMFHRMPPTSPASRIISSGVPPSLTNSGRGVPSGFWILMTALVTVNATLTDRKAPTRFSEAHSMTAARGRSAFVAILVAIAFAVSWKPLVKSNARAVMMTRTKRRNPEVTLAW